MGPMVVRGCKIRKLSPLVAKLLFLGLRHGLKAELPKIWNFKNYSSAIDDYEYVLANTMWTSWPIGLVVSRVGSRCCSRSSVANNNNIIRSSCFRDSPDLVCPTDTAGGNLCRLALRLECGFKCSRYSLNHCSKLECHKIVYMERQQCMVQHRNSRWFNEVYCPVNHDMPWLKYRKARFLFIYLYTICFPLFRRQHVLAMLLLFAVASSFSIILIMIILCKEKRYMY